MPHSTIASLPRATWLGSLSLFIISTGCAINVSEVRSARVLRGGEVQVSQVNNVVVPTSAFGDVIKPAKAAASAVKDDRALTDAEKRDVVRGATAIALSSPGYGTHLDIAFGLGYRFDAQARIGNGVYGLSLRRGFDLGKWHASLGLRGAYNTGSSVVPYLNNINTLVKVGGMKRFDGQAFGMLGREFGEVAKFWMGAKAIDSRFTAEVDAGKLDLGKQPLEGRIGYYGGFIGGAIGFRFIHFVVELTVLQVHSDEFVLFDSSIDPDGWILAPSWGFQGTF